MSQMMQQEQIVRLLWEERGNDAKWKMLLLGTINQNDALLPNVCPPEDLEDLE